MGLKKTRIKQIGQSLIEKGLLTQEQLDQALEVQLKEGGLLGQILVKLGFVSQEDIEVTLYEQAHSAQKLENILLELQIINQQQLEKAIQIQKSEGGLLVRAIVRSGALTEEDLVGTLVTQQGFPYLQLDNYEMDAEVVKLIPEETARKYCLIAIDKIGDILTLAMADPLNSAAIGEIKKLTGLNVETFITTVSDIEGAITRFYA